MRSAARTATTSAALALAALASCGREPRDHEPGPVPAPAPRDAARGWPALASFARITAVRSVALPARADVPRVDVSGPAIVGDIAVVASSQFGFVAVDLRRGEIAWSKPAGLHVAPPLATATGFLLIGDCVAPPAVADDRALLGCMRAVTAAGADERYLAIVARDASFTRARGAQQLVADAHTARWQRGDVAVAIDRMTGAATPVPVAAARDDDAPHDLHGLPGIAVLDRATGARGQLALAIRLDRSLRRDYVARAGDAGWHVYALPEQPRADPIGLAFTPGGAIVVFHDGDSLAILASENPTP